MATEAQTASPTIAPPAIVGTGPIGWMRKNLFATPADTALTVLIALILVWAVPPVVRWGILDATWVAQTREQCGPDGACWGIVPARLHQYIFGLYPIDQQWRVILGAVLLLAGVVPFFLKAFPKKAWYGLGFVIVYPMLASILFEGGVFGLAQVDSTLWGGLFLTLLISIVGIAASFPIGILLALGRRSDLPIIRSLSVAFIELIRGVPLVTVLFMASVMLPLFFPPGWNIDKLARALIGVTIFSGAYLAEVIRGGLQAIPKGQYEAAKAMGLGYWQSMFLIILPQALKLVIPGIVNSFISLFKDTSLVFIMGLYDLLNIAKLIVVGQDWLGHDVESYIFAGFGFWIFCFAMSRFSQRLERRLNTGHRH
jgi:general L-amino acid transport system permease protein